MEQALTKQAVEQEPGQGHVHGVWMAVGGGSGLSLLSPSLLLMPQGTQCTPGLLLILTLLCPC